MWSLEMLRLRSLYGLVVDGLRAARFKVAALAVLTTSSCLLGVDDQEVRLDPVLPIPPVLAPVRTEGNTDFYALTQKRGVARPFPSNFAIPNTTPVEGYDGTWPGPTLRVRRGRPVVVTQQNLLDHPVVVHNHGHRAEAASDGHPVDFIMPGGVKEFHYPNDQHAATFWLHDHTHNVTSLNVWNGLASFYIIDDDDWDRMNLPKGQYDVPLLLQDRLFNADGSLFYPGPPDEIGLLYGDTSVVNGARTPRLEVQQRKYLFRLLDGADHRIYRLYFQRLDSKLGTEAPLEPFDVVASDGGLLPRSIRRQDLIMGPGERYGVVVDFSRFPVGTRIMLRNNEPPPQPRFARLDDVMSFVVTGPPPEPDTSVVPAELLPIEKYRVEDVAVTREIVFGRVESASVLNGGDWYINDKFYDPARIDFKGKRGTLERWNIHNGTSRDHTLHIHLDQFQLLSSSLGPLQPEWGGWKDTVLLRAFQNVSLLIKWTGPYTGTYIFHCHVIGHEDNAMMAQFEITE